MNFESSKLPEESAEESKTVDRSSTAERDAKSRDQLLKEIESGPISVTIDRKRGIMRHVWPLITAVTVFAAAHRGYGEEPGAPREKEPIAARARISSEAVGRSAEKSPYQKNLEKINESPEIKDGEKVAQELTRLVPSEMIDDIKYGTYLMRLDEDITKLSKEAGKERTAEPVSVSGFEQVSPEAAKLVSDLWNEDNGFYPRGWIKGQIRSIGYSADVKKSERTKPGSSEIYRTQTLGEFLPGGKSVTMYTNSFKSFEALGQKEAVSMLDKCFAHEIGHANDWECNGRLLYMERLELLRSILDRLGATNRFQSDYVERISHADKKSETARKAEEYWAELCAEYFRNPGFKRTHPDDFQIVNAVVKKSDKEFNPVNAGRHAALLGSLEWLRESDEDKEKMRVVIVKSEHERRKTEALSEELRKRGLEDAKEP